MSDLFSKGLAELRDKLIDTSRRNKLINYRRPSKTRNLRIIDESPEFIYKFLVKDEGVFKFNFIPEPAVSKKDIEALDQEIAEKKKIFGESLKDGDIKSSRTLQIAIKRLQEQKENLQKQALLSVEEMANKLGYSTLDELQEIDINTENLEKKYTDNLLQTLHYPNEMERILTLVERDAKAIIEETGSNMLYLILGTLKWNESKNSDQFNSSPLVSIPVILNKEKRNNRYEFTLEYSGEGIETNKSLSEKLNNDYGIILPELTEEIGYHEYIKEVTKVIEFQKDWSLKHEIAIDFLKFGKMLIYQDLNEENWGNGESLSEKKVLKDIFEGKEISEPLIFAEEYDIDSDDFANKIPLVMNADSSQHSAIIDVIKGKNIVIEGPPGTGKSQTISNLIAVLLAEGKSILFVSEKLAALEVVYKRLHSIGLSDFCLELHSNKSQKIKVLESIKKRIESKYSFKGDIGVTIEQMESKKKELEEYINLLHESYGAIGKKIYNIFWLTEMRSHTSKYLKYDIPDANEYTPYKLKNTIDELKKYQSFLKEHDFNTFYWKGINTYNLSFIDIELFMDDLKELKEYFIKLQEHYIRLDTQVENEHIEAERICCFIDNLNGISANYSKEILINLSKNENVYDEYLAIFENINFSISNIENDIKVLLSCRKIFENFSTNIKTIKKILSNIQIGTNVSMKKDIDFINQLCSGIKYLSNIDKRLLPAINKSYLNESLSDNLEQIREELGHYHSLRDKLMSIVLLEKIDTIESDEIEKIEKIINSKKDSFLNFIYKDYRESKNFLDLVIVGQLPKDKSTWGGIINQIKEYILFKNNFEKNVDYMHYFGKLFDGFKTNIEDIEKIQEWTLELRKEINIHEILDLIFSGNLSKYNLLKSHEASLEENLSLFNVFLDEIEKTIGKKFVKKLYLDRDIIEIDELGNRLIDLNDDMAHLLESFFKMTNLNQDSISENHLLKLIHDENLENIFLKLKRNDIGINHLVSNFEDLIISHAKIKQLVKNSKIELNFDLYNKIIETKNLYDFIYSSDLDINLKRNLIKNIENIDILKMISVNMKSIKEIYNKIESKVIIEKCFFGESSRIIEYIQKLDKIDENKNLSVWIDFRQIAQNLDNRGLGVIVEGVETNTLPTDQIIENFLYNFYNTLLKGIFRKYDTFNKFNRLSHEKSIEAFRNLDKKLIELNKKRVAYLTSKRDIPLGYRGNKVSDLTDYSLIEHEISKKKKHIPIRQMISRASKAIQALKPCFMMSPLSVSQYLPPNQIEFDVLIIDEASQLKPEEALGAIARSKQIVIVGDPKQLPPTSFFDAMNQTEEQEMVTSESESILDICLKIYRPIRRLRWHYRSQHESLIGFSNRRFYDNDLIIFPSSSSINNDSIGVKHHYIENSIYKNNSNKIEAEAILNHLEYQIRNYPDRSIGIGTLNSTQRDLIQEMIDQKEKESPIISGYFSKWSNTNEAFFVKNLENLQGDERDVIFISTTFGKDAETGRVYQRFGPINSESGWRRLNVMLTRAKQKMEIFTSLRSNDIITTDHSSKGVRELKAFLEYLERDSISVASQITDIDRAFDSEFEKSVFDILKDYGFESVPQVGVAGYFIDLAVKSTENPNDFVLAIECDGATYHSSKSARDRDRLRQDVLEALGWSVYRIWSVDWYKNRENEISKLIRAINEAQANYNEKLFDIQRIKHSSEEVG